MRPEDFWPCLATQTATSRETRYSPVARVASQRRFDRPQRLRDGSQTSGFATHNGLAFLGALRMSETGTGDYYRNYSYSYRRTDSHRRWVLYGFPSP